MKKPYTTLADLKEQIDTIKKLGYDLENIAVMISEDDEVNGFHTAWNRQGLSNGKELLEFESESMMNISLPYKIKGSEDELFYLIF